MSSYFPIPPTIKIDGYSEKILGSTTFLNTPNNRLKKLFWKDYKTIIYLGIYHFNESSWSLKKVYKCKPNEFIEIQRKKFKVKDNDMLVAVPRKKNDFKQNTILLPIPDSLRIDRSPIAERAALNFSFYKSTVSYQGEYPFKMTCLKKSSFLSFDILKETNKSEALNYLILMNLTRDQKSQDNVKVYISKALDNNSQKFIVAKKNSFTIHKFENSEKSNREIFSSLLKTKECSFIPIFLAVDLNSKQLSVEHTHPTSELFFGTNKFEIANSIKRKWLK